MARLGGCLRERTEASVSTNRWYTVAVAVLFVSALATPTDARRYTVRCLEGARCDLDNEHNGICTFSGDSLFKYWGGAAGILMISYSIWL